MPTVCGTEQDGGIIRVEDRKGERREGWLFGGWGLSITLSGNTADIKPLHRYAFEIQEA